MIRGFISVTQVDRQRDQADRLLRKQGMVRLSEFTRAGITAATISRMVANREVIRLARGLNQLPDAPLNANHSLAEAAKRVPKGVICLVSALAFHELTDQLPRVVWMAVGAKDWAPRGGTLAHPYRPLHKNAADGRYGHGRNRRRSGEDLQRREDGCRLFSPSPDGRTVGRD